MKSWDLTDKGKAWAGGVVLDLCRGEVWLGWCEKEGVLKWTPYHKPHYGTQHCPCTKTTVCVEAKWIYSSMNIINPSVVI